MHLLWLVLEAGEKIIPPQGNLQSKKLEAELKWRLYVIASNTDPNVQRNAY